MVSGESAIEVSNPEEVTGPYNPWLYLKANFLPATLPRPILSWWKWDRVDQLGMVKFVRAGTGILLLSLALHAVGVAESANAGPCSLHLGFSTVLKSTRANKASETLFNRRYMLDMTPT